MAETVKLEEQKKPTASRTDYSATWTAGQSTRRIEITVGKVRKRYEHSETLANGTRVFRHMDSSPV